MIKHIAYAGAAFAIAALLSGYAAAQTNAASPGPSIIVHYGDLDLSRRADAVILLARVETASRVVCGREPDLRDLAHWSVFKRCINGAVGNAVAFVNRPIVAELYGKPVDAPVAHNAVNSDHGNIAAMQPPEDNSRNSVAAAFTR